jgi:hypothetical protein
MSWKIHDLTIFYHLDVDVVLVAHPDTDGLDPPRRGREGPLAWLWPIDAAQRRTAWLADPPDRAVQGERERWMDGATPLSESEQWARTLESTA